MIEVTILDSEWKELRENVKQNWKALTANDLNQIDGHSDVLVDLLQEKYGSFVAIAPSESIDAGKAWLSAARLSDT